MRKKLRTKATLFVSITLLLSSFLSNQSLASSKNTLKDECIKKFLVIDVGSSTTKSVLYTKDVCRKNKTIKKQIFNKNCPYQACLSDSESDILPKQCIEKGVKTLRAIKGHFKLDCKTTQCAAIATGWARHAKNIEDWKEAVEEIGVNPIVASQDYEGEMKIRIIKEKVISDNEPFMAFDIGGGSFQLGWFDHENNLHQYNSQYGTDNFTHLLQQKFFSEKEQKCAHARNDLLMVQNDEKLLKKALDDEKSFCSADTLVSIKISDIDKAISYADEIIGTPIKANKGLQKIVSAGKKPKIYADSLLFSLGMRKQLGFDKDIITVHDIHKVLTSVSGMNYDEIKATYPKLPDICLYTTQPAMLILYSILKNLNIEEIHIIQTDYMEHFVDSNLKKDL